MGKARGRQPGEGGPSPAASDGALPKLKALYEFMTRHNLEALELDQGPLHVRMVRRRAQAQVPVPVAVSAAPQGPAAAPAGPALPPGAVAVKAPMMGIFYRASSPSSPPFVKEGDKVSGGQVLCMIEAMKVFNEIKAEFPCEIMKILVENGKPVKSGQDLFLLSR